MTDSAELDLRQVTEPLHERVTFYVGRLRAICGPRLLAVTLHGELPTGAPGDSRTAASVCVFDAVDFELLSAIGREGARFGRMGFAAPWPLTPRFLEDSRDSFPLELIDIQQQHSTVFGPDLFMALQFEAEHVRLQCERELKMVEIQLQRGLLASAGDERALAGWCRQLAPTLLRVVRGLLWLAGNRQPGRRFDLVRSLEHKLGSELAGVRRVLDDSDTDSRSMLRQLHADVATMKAAGLNG